MKKLYLSKTINLILFILFFIALELAQFNFLFEDIAFPAYGYFEVLLMLALGGIIFMPKNRIFDAIYLPIIYGIVVIFTCVNVNFFNTTGDIFSMTNLYLVKNSLNVAASASSFNVPFTVLAALSVVLLVGLIVGNSFILKIDTKALVATNYKHARIAITLAGILTGFLIFITSFMSFTVPNNIRNTVMLEKVSNFKDLGMLGYYAEEIPYILNGSRTDSNTEAELKEYFTTEKRTDNAYTGLLEGMNVVTIVVETGDDLMLNPTLLPNLYSLFEDSINLPRNYSKNKTNMSEFIGFVGSAPVVGIHPEYDYKLPFSIPEILKAEGYRTAFFHDAPKERDVYSRREIMPKLGFEEMYFRPEMFPGAPGWDFSGSYSWDSDCMPVVADILLNPKDKALEDKPFYAVYTTLSMHGPYDKPANHDRLVMSYGDEYQRAILNGDFVNPLKGTINEHCVDNFMMACMDFDLGLSRLIKAFKDAGEYDNTLFVLYGDHEMYYVGADGIPLNKTLAGTKDMSNTKMYHTMMSFTNPKLKAKWGDLVYNQFTSPYNIVPTVLDLLGIDYNPNYYIGHSLFQEEMRGTQAFYTLEQAGFFNEDYWSIDHEKIYRSFNSNPGSEEEFLKEIERIYTRESMLDIIFTTDYFTHHDFKDYTF